MSNNFILFLVACHRVAMGSASFAGKGGGIPLGYPWGVSNAPKSPTGLSKGPVPRTPAIKSIEGVNGGSIDEGKGGGPAGWLDSAFANPQVTDQCPDNPAPLFLFVKIMKRLLTE